MSRDIQLYATPGNPNALPAAPDDLFHSGTTALGAHTGGFGGHAAPAPSPLKKIQRLLRGREKLAIFLGLTCAIIGGAAGWLTQRPQFVSKGVVWIRPIIPRLLDSDKVMPFYTFYVQSQTAIITGPKVIERAVQSNEWKSTGMSSGPDGQALLMQNLDVDYPKNSQHIMVSCTDDRSDIAQAAVRSVVHAYESLYSDANGADSQKRLDQIEGKRNELEGNIRGLEAQKRALVDAHGSDDLSVLYNESMKHLIQLKDQVRNVQTKLDAAKAGMAAQQAAADPAKGMTIDQIAAMDPTMKEYLRLLDQYQMRFEQLKRNLGPGTRIYQDAADDIRIQQQRINAYADSFRKQFVGPKILIPETGAVINLTKEMLDQYEMQSASYQKQLEKDEADAKKLSEDWAKMLDIKQKYQRFQTEKDKYDRQYDEQVAQVAMGGTLQVISDGDTPIPAPDKRKQFAFVGAVGGGAAPIALLLLIGLMDGKMRYSEEAGQDMRGMTLLGILPELPDRLTDPAQAATAAHCVHQIRTMLQINCGEGHNVFAVTSAAPGDGKTSLTLALGLSFAASGSRTLLIDCDLVGAGLTARLDMSGPDGVLEAMSTRDLMAYCRATDIADLSMLPVGQAQAHHAGMFSPQALRRLLAEAKKHFEIILIDSGPVLGSIEATPVCAAADGVVLCVSRTQQRAMVEKAIEHLMSIGAKFAGVVFNRAQAKDFARSISGISLRSIARHQSTPQQGAGSTTNGNGNGGHKSALGPVARAVASSVKPPQDDAA
jgi:capsular exopolysaccharide synthesis family protein